MKNDFIWGFMLKLSSHMWDDEVTPPPAYLPNVYTENNNIDVSVWDETVEKLAEMKFNTVLIDVGDGIKYESHPEISSPDAWDKDFLGKKLDEMRILGLTPIPKLNFSAGHDTWLKGYRIMLSTPTYYSLCSDIIKEVCEAFGYPSLFHIGFDEETAAQQVNNEMIIVRGKDLWWHDLNFFARECVKHGARPWMWSDYVWHNRELFINNMSKDILQSNWFYGRFKYAYSNTDADYKCVEAYELLDKLGFDQIPTCSTWGNVWNTRQTLAYGKATLSSEHLKGYLTAPWLFTTRDNAYGLLCDAQRFYFGRKEFYPESF